MAAARGKHGSAAVARWEYRLGDHLVRLQRALAAGRWQPGAYQRFVIEEPKRRVISAAPFADRVVHHALMRVTAHRFERDFCRHSFANRVGLGTLRAVQHASRLCKAWPWALRLDVKQHFQSIDHEILLGVLERRIREPELARIVRSIVASGAADAADDAGPLYLQGDDLFAACRPRGLPIGNLTSQFWSNVYLDPLDQFITRELGCKAYARYVDDMLLCADSKHTLAGWRQAILQFARQRLRLRLHEHSAQANPTRAGVPWLGFVVYPEHRLLKSRKVVATTRGLTRAWQAWQAGEASFDDFDARVQGWIAHARHASSWRLRETVLSRFNLAPPGRTGHR
jgi:hypothetical protein